MPDAAPFQYLFLSGTSFSAPTVSGIVALMLDKNPTLSNADADTPGSLIGDPSTWDEGQVEDLFDSAAVDIPGASVVTTFRTGDADTECWEQPACPLEATGSGWLFVYDVLAATP